MVTYELASSLKRELVVGSGKRVRRSTRGRATRLVGRGAHLEVERGTFQQVLVGQVVLVVRLPV
jgi:hypothetical protein